MRVPGILTTGALASSSGKVAEIGCYLWSQKLIPPGFAWSEIS